MMDDPSGQAAMVEPQRARIAVGAACRAASA
jgi:hypothetical protein